MDEIGSDKLKMILDCANLFHAGTAYRENVQDVIAHAFDLFGDDIVIAHGKDIKEGSGIEFCGTGLGIVDFGFTAMMLEKYGYTGEEFSKILLENNLVSEFSDPDFVVLMLTPENGESDLEILRDVLFSVPKKDELTEKPPRFSKPKIAFGIREASLSAGEKIPVSESIGRVLAISDVSCPPAVPIAVSGEVIDEHAVRCFEYYGTEYCTVMEKLICE
jgi:hypothetical protein